MNLYQIDAEILKVIDFETGEVLDEDKLEELQMSKNEKIENILLYIKNLNADAEIIKAEEKALAERRKAKENKGCKIQGRSCYAISRVSAFRGNRI